MYRERRPLISTHDFRCKASSKKRKRRASHVVRAMARDAIKSGLTASLGWDVNAYVKAAITGIAAEVRLARRPVDTSPGNAFARSSSEALVKSPATKTTTRASACSCSASLKC